MLDIISISDKFTAEITDMNNFGNGVCRLNQNGKVIFIEGAVTGDIVVGEITQINSGYMKARLVSINRRSEKRIISKCNNFGKCGGCDFLHINYNYELELKREFIKSAFKKCGLDIQIPPISDQLSSDIELSILDEGLFKKVPNFSDSEKILAYRNKIIVHCNQNLEYGYYRSGSNVLIPFDFDNVGKRRPCMLHPTIFDEILLSVAEILKNKGAINIRGIYLRRGAISGEIMVCAMIEDDKIKTHSGEDISLYFAQNIAKKHSSIKSVLIGVCSKKKIAELEAKRYIKIWGSDTIADTMCGINYKISPASFYQINHAASELLYAKTAALAKIKSGERVLDLYCGMGTITLYLANCHPKAEFLGMEIIPEAIADAKSAAKANGIHNAGFICGDVETIRAGKTDVVIVDPPRRGCSHELLEKIINISPNRIIYVSCNPQTLARDVAILASDYEISEICGVNMFPRTGHVECVVKLCRVEK